MFCPQYNKPHQRIEKQLSLWKPQANELEMWTEAAPCFFAEADSFIFSGLKQYGRIQPNRIVVNIEFAWVKKCCIYSNFGKLLNFVTCRKEKRTFFRDKCLSFFLLFRLQVSFLFSNKETKQKYEKCNFWDIINCGKSRTRVWEFFPLTVLISVCVIPGKGPLF